MKIYAPVKDANGVYASVRFVNGVGETENPSLINWFATHGYTLEKCDISMPNEHEKCDNFVNDTQNDEIKGQYDEVELMGYAEKSPNFEDMTPNELRDWAKANGFGSKIKNIRNKEKLIEILRG